MVLFMNIYYINLHIYNISRLLIPTMERKDKRMHPEDVGAGSSGGKRRRHVLTIQQKVEVLRKIDCGVRVSSSGVWCWAIRRL
jgi:hypothetical protein